MLGSVFESYRTRKIVILILCVPFSNSVLGQSDSSSFFDLNILVDGYYVNDFNNPSNKYRQTFLYNYNRHQIPAINLALIGIRYETKSFRTLVTLHGGTYVNDNYANEPEFIQHIHQALVGVRLSRTYNLWLEGGIFDSHLGSESVRSNENNTLSRSLAAENSPYYLAGFRLISAPNNHWNFKVLILNGWQRIKPVEGNSLPSFGSSMKYLSSKFAINWNTFLGTDDPDSSRRIRFFNNLFGNYTLNKKWTATLGFDYGLQEEAMVRNKFDNWLGWTFIVLHEFNLNWKLAGRIEQYTDHSNVIVSSYYPLGFKVSGLSVNLDRSIQRYLLVRTEVRWMKSPNKIFQTDAGFSQDNVAAFLSLVLMYNKSIR